MKQLFFTLTLLISNFSFAINYEFKEASFAISASLEDSSSDPAIITPVFKLAGTALLIEDKDGYELPTARITIRRTTYECDEVTYDYTRHFNCNLYGKKFLEILDDAITDDASFAVARDIIERNFDDASYYSTFNIPLGMLEQENEMQTQSEIVDPQNDDHSVVFTLKYSGLKPL